MPEVRTDVIVQAKAKGFADVQRQAARVTEQGAKAIDSQTKGFEKMESQIMDVAKALKELGRGFEGIQRTMQRSMQGMTRDLARQQARGGLMQGFLQGAAPGVAQGLQRGPGMQRQMFGMAAGRAVRGAAMAPFGGVGGLAQAISTIPVVGGAGAGQIQTGMQLAGQAMQVQRARVGALPFMGGPLPGMRVGAAGRARATLAGMEASLRTVSQEDLLAAGGARDPAFEERFAETAGMNPAEKIRARMMRDVGRRSEVIAGKRDDKLENEIRAQRDAAATETVMRRERQKARVEPFQTIRAAGVRFGAMGEAEALQAAGGMAQAGGGTIANLRRQGLLRTGFAAQTAFGVGPGVAGAFAQAGGQGGLAGMAPGGGGRGARAMTQGIADAMKMGLEGSELRDYLQQMAAGINQWRTTGIPLAGASIASMGLALGQSGLGGIRASAVARGFAGAAQQLSKGGPQNATQLMMLQTMGGFQGGGAEAFEEAQVQLERGGTGDQMDVLMRRFMSAGGGGAQGRVFARMQLGKMGVQFGAEEFRLLGKELKGEKLSVEELKRKEFFATERDRVGKLAPTSPRDIQARAAKIIGDFGGGLKAQAKLQNQQNAIGEKWIGTMHTLQKSAANVSSAFTSLGSETIQDLAQGMADFTKWLAEKTKNGGEEQPDVVVP